MESAASPTGCTLAFKFFHLCAMDARSTLSSCLCCSSCARDTRHARVSGRAATRHASAREAPRPLQDCTAVPSSASHLGVGNVRPLGQQREQLVAVDHSVAVIVAAAENVAHVCLVDRTAFGRHGLEDGEQFVRLECAGGVRLCAPA